MTKTLLLISALSLIGCNQPSSDNSQLSQGTTRLSTEDLAQGVKEAYQEDFAAEDIIINNLILTHKSGNEYSGFMETTEPGGDFQYSMDVVYDGETFTSSLN